LATLAPAQSPWGQWFSKWKEAAEKKADGKLRVVWHWNGVEGPEPSVVGKIKAGQLWGAAVTAVGLSQIYGPINALQMPGMFKSWADLDKARDMLQPEFDAKLKEAGFYVSGWGDVGRARTMSKGFLVKSPADLAGKSPGFLEGDRVAPKVYESINGFLSDNKLAAVTPKSTQVIEILTQLNNGTINVLTTPALAAEQLQWTSRLDHINTEVVSYGVGAMVISQGKLDELPPDMRKMMQDLGARTSEFLAKEIRGQDDRAFERAKSNMTKGGGVHQPSDAERKGFRKLYRTACNKVDMALASDVLKRINAKRCKKPDKDDPPDIDD
jgi:TRAP-type C4-dicarboxylate transport system substrate-binding protein